jgi:D-sedoheptulose 7-phosphate isomerase
METITVLVFDIDGVLTDGRESIADGATPVKRLHLRDLDAFARARHEGLLIALLTGESGVLVDRIGQRIDADLVVAARKDKRAGLAEVAERLGVPMAAICYTGDALRDALAFDLAGLSCAPADAAPVARARATRVLATRGGEGVAEEVVDFVLAARADAACAPRREADLRRVIEDSLAAHQTLLKESVPVLAQVAAILTKTLRFGGTVLLCGNGGSAADAQHVASELVGRFAMESDPWPAIALTTDTSILTAVANDWEFADVFGRQVRAHARPGDLVVGITTSGRSPNVLRALKDARALGAATVGFTGARPGPLGAESDVCFCAPATATPRIQELHLLAWHGICEIVERALSGPTVSEEKK